jgi:DNA-binding MarR family transcriptional regulator
MPRPTRTDLALNDTPALSVLRQRAHAFPDIDARALRVSQDLLRVAKRVLGTFGDEFTRYGISPGRYSVLMELYHAKAGLVPSELAERIGVTRATITGLVEGLSDDGLVLRGAPDDGDRRRKAVRLSAPGRRLLQRILPAIFERMVAVVSPLSAREQAVLQRLLLKIERRATFQRSTDD